MPTIVGHTDAPGAPRSMLRPRYRLFENSQLITTFNDLWVKLLKVGSGQDHPMFEHHDALDDGKQPTRTFKVTVNDKMSKH